MKRSAPLRRKTALRPYSLKRIGFEEELDGMRELVLARSGGRCELGATCCTGLVRDVHHRKNRGQGGTNDLVNLLGACRACHDYAHRNPAQAYSLGWLVNSWQDPAAVEVRAFWNGLPPIR